MTHTPEAPATPDTPAWRRLTELRNAQRNTVLLQRFSDDPQRAARFSLAAGPLHADFSKQHIDEDVLLALLALAEERGVSRFLHAVMDGDIVNITEGRSAAHNRLREAAATDSDIVVMRSQLAALVEAVHSGSFCGADGAPFADLVHIGIGGSDLGPQLVCDCLAGSETPRLRLHFVSNIDPAALSHTLASLNPATTLFAVSTKSFSTEETLSNAASAKAWLQAQLPDADANAQFVAVTAKPAAAAAFGIAEQKIVRTPDWVGGRFSLWSATGLPIALGFGMQRFEQLLAGGAAIDRHVAGTPLRDNLPVLLGLLDVWNRNLLGLHSLAVIPYDHSLRLLPSHLQQLLMESAGKSVSATGQPLTLHSCPVIWGSEGSNAQHSFFQMLHQGSEVVPVDFILPLSSHHPLGDQHRKLVAKCLGQSLALMAGQNATDIAAQLQSEGLDAEAAATLAAHKTMPGNRPSTTISVAKTDAHSLGALIALYEHRLLTACAVWDINPFDQWGVELGKRLSRSLMDALGGGDVSALDGSTRQLVERYRAVAEAD